METTFITIQDLSPDARFLYTSDSIVDILGYSPEEVVNRSCWEFFHPDDLPIAKAKHGRGIELDKAAILSYCRMKGKDGRWQGCEMVFTVVYNVLVGCISIYRRGLKSESRAIAAPAIRRLFSTSPRDPRYHMLSHLSSKFSAPSPKACIHEPRAALFLNRYTRTLTIMYATDGLADLLGIGGNEMIGQSFYYCIQENCLQDSVRCLENAKANDSIAYMRFWWRDPRTDNGEAGQDPQRTMEDDDAVMTDVRSSDEDTEDDVGRFNEHAEFSRNISIESEPLSSTDSVEPAGTSSDQNHLGVFNAASRTSSAESGSSYTHEAVFGNSRQTRSSASSTSQTPATHENHANGSHLREALELEAVVSCASDGLVVCLRKANPLLPQISREQVPVPQTVQQPGRSGYANGLFAVPWSSNPMLPPPHVRPQYAQHSGFAPGLTPAQAYRAPTNQTSGPSKADFMSSIRDIAVFAWALVGINGSLEEYSHGVPRGEAQPESGLPVWQPENGQFSEASRSDAGSSGQTSSRSVQPPAKGTIDPTGNERSSTGKNYHQSSPLMQPHMVDGVGNKFENHMPREDSGQDMKHPIDLDQSQRLSPSMQSHMVDNVASAFDYTPEANRDARKSSGRSSGFGFGDPGLSAKSPPTFYSNFRPTRNDQAMGDGG